MLPICGWSHEVPCWVCTQLQTGFAYAYGMKWLFILLLIIKVVLILVTIGNKQLTKTVPK